MSNRLAEIRKRLSDPELPKWQASPEAAYVIIHDVPYLLTELDRALKLLSLAAEFCLSPQWRRDVEEFVHSHGLIESWEPLVGQRDEGVDR